MSRREYAPTDVETNAGAISTTLHCNALQKKIAEVLFLHAEVQDVGVVHEDGKRAFAEPARRATHSLIDDALMQLDKRQKTLLATKILKCGGADLGDGDGGTIEGHVDHTSGQPDTRVKKAEKVIIHGKRDLLLFKSQSIDAQKRI